MASFAEIPAETKQEPIAGVLLVKNASQRPDGTVRSYNAHPPHAPKVQYNLVGNLFEAAVEANGVEVNEPKDCYGLWEVTGLTRDVYVADGEGGYGVVHSVDVLTAVRKTITLESAKKFGDDTENSRSTSNVLDGQIEATRAFGGGAVGAIMRRKPAPASK